MELYDLPQGAISIAHCDAELCIGTLELDPDSALDRHNRPVDEELIQLHGSCVMTLW